MPSKKIAPQHTLAYVRGDLLKIGAKFTNQNDFLEALE